jgi:hypothetical protein
VSDVRLNERMVFAKRGDKVRDVDRPHALGLQRAEQDRSTDAAANGVHGVAGGRRRGGRRPRLRK